MKLSAIIRFSVIQVLAVLALSLFIMACTKSGSSDGGDGGSSNPPPSNGGNQAEARTNCGVVIEGKVVNPITDSNGVAVKISQVADSNAFIVTTDTGNILVKLHGVSNEPSNLRENAINYLKKYTGRTVLYIRASSSCSAVISGGGLAQVGQLITSSGESINESVIQTGFTNPSSADGCSSALITTCLKALQESEPQTAGELSSFLWKPQSDSNGNLAIHTGPYGTSVSVNGETGENQGSGNGYGSLARFNRPGCAYAGARVVVRARSGFPYTVGGQTSFTVGNPCGRNCLVNGSIVACSKN